MKYKYEFDQLIIELYGDVDEHYVKKIRDDIDFLISRQGISSVVFDFKNVSFVDSTGLGLIFGRYKKLLARKVELLLRNVPSHVDRVFRASGVYSVCPKI
ncbi:MAG: anti-sigma factor antagonist [Clostridia bacterium]|nr:anti-sigma factor antagonist [Clostridia bacterium]MBR2918442.1 anti-sigma factor antagonist [Clostridia bacterium]